MSRVGGLARRVWDLISSRRLSMWLMLALALGYLVWVAPFQVYGVPAERVRNIASGPVFEALGWALLVNAVACVARNIPRVVKRSSASSGAVERLLSGSQAVGVTSPLEPSRASRLAARRLRWRGYAVRSTENLVVARFGRYSSAGTILSHAALALLAVSFIVTGQGHFRGKAVLVEGEMFDGSIRESYVEPNVDEMLRIPESLLPEATFELLTVTPEFWRDVQLFTRLDARISGGGERSRIIAVNRPAQVGEASVAIDGFGYAPELRIAGPEGEVMSGFAKMQVFPPGSIDRFEIPESPYQIEMRIFPDATVSGAEIVNRTFNLDDPLISLRVRDVTLDESGIPAYEGALRLGEVAEFFGYTVSVPSIRYYAELRIVRDPGVPWFIAALVCGLAGLFVRVAMRQRLVVVEIVATGGGSELRVAAQAELWRTAWREKVADGVARSVGGRRAGDDDPATGGEAGS